VAGDVAAWSTYWNLLHNKKFSCR